MANLNFHQTFKPEKEYISVLLEQADEIDNMDPQEISMLTGIPTGVRSGKVEPHIKYAEYMGLINVERRKNKYSLSKTTLGKLVCKEDPGLLEEVTILTLHCMLCRNEGGAELWNKMFTHVFPTFHNKVSLDTVMLELKKDFPTLTQKNFSPFVNSYLDLFAPLNILNVQGNTYVLKPLSVTDICIYVYGYVLYTLWETAYPGEQEVTIDQINDCGFASLFGWDSQQEIHCLEKLQEKRIIRLNRQLVPITVFMLSTKDSIETKLYSELF